ncbi:hypothetical protein R3P38DRAFT_2815083 [Favolaschia claudopus]|uniref:TRAPPC10/Trs130 N-terminal domain-containing protein n=1 Tax=Favolaschia claudopus TaxID=2862362 RepID=A0AAV9Z233_9AGAR
MKLKYGYERCFSATILFNAIKMSMHAGRSLKATSFLIGPISVVWRVNKGNGTLLVSHSGAQACLSSGSWDQIHTALLAQLPLEVPATLLEKPFLNMYLVTCARCKDWHAVVSSRKNQEWLILHVVRPDARTHGGNFFQLKGSVLDKLKGDFNTDRRDREDEVKRSESQRQMPGWNFCTFFTLKESLAGSFQGVNLFEDTLVQYDELEASFYQVLKEKNLSWFRYSDSQRRFVPSALHLQETVPGPDSCQHHIRV